MHDAESAVSALRALRAQGVHLAVDDFGTGYSSLLYLKRFPVEALKVDRTFVDGLGREPEDSAIVGAVVSLAHSLEPPVRRRGRRVARASSASSSASAATSARASSSAAPERPTTSAPSPPAPSPCLAALTPLRRSTPVVASDPHTAAV